MWIQERLYFYVFIYTFFPKSIRIKLSTSFFLKQQQQSGRHPLLITPFFSSDLYILFDSPDFDLLNIFLSSVLPLHWPLYDSFCFLPRPLPNDPPSSPSQYPESRVVDFSYIPATSETSSCWKDGNFKKVVYPRKFWNPQELLWSTED